MVWNDSLVFFPNFCITSFMHIFSLILLLQKAPFHIIYTLSLLSFINFFTFHVYLKLWCEISCLYFTVLYYPLPFSAYSWLYLNMGLLPPVLHCVFVTSVGRVSSLVSHFPIQFTSWIFHRCPFLWFGNNCGKISDSSKNKGIASWSLWISASHMSVIYLRNVFFDVCRIWSRWWKSWREHCTICNIFYVPG